MKDSSEKKPNGFQGRVIHSRYLIGIVEGITTGNKEVYNPVLFYGERKDVAAVLDVIAYEYEKKQPNKRIKRISGDGFVNCLVREIKNGTVNDLFKHLTACDLLIFEGVEVISGGLEMMHQFYSIFDKVFESGGQIVIGSSVPPSVLLSLDDRVRTQLEAGIVCSVYE